MKKIKTASLAVGAAFAATVLSPAAFAGGNPFAMHKLDSGYQVAAADTDKKVDGKCGEGKCGAKMKKKEGKCGTDKKQDSKLDEGRCGAGKKMEEPAEKPKAEDAK